MNMNKKTIIEAAVAVAVIAAGAFAYMHYKQGAEPAAFDPNLVAPAGTVTAISPSSISIRQQDGAQKTFAIGPDTLVISQVAAGETGKSLADITAGTLVILRPSPANPGALASIQISGAGAPPAPGAAAAAPSGPPVSFMGTVVTVSPSALVIKPQEPNAEDVEVAITAGTVVRSNVLAGQKGKTFEDIAAGTPVFIAGTTGDAGVTANIVQVLVPIEELAQ
jgi:hypothetical protein